MLRCIKRICCVRQLQPGMILGQDIMSREGKVLLSQGINLTERNIFHLQQLGEDSFFIIEILAEGCQQQTDFVQTYKEMVSTVKVAFDHITFFKEVPLAKMRELVNYSINPIVEATSILSYLHMLKNQDEYTFQHSVNVAIIAGIIGKWRGYKGKDLGDLILSGLLHDIGKTQIPLTILNKPGKLTAAEMDEIKRHPGEGYNIVKYTDVSEDIKLGILQHHERNDGTGYPAGARLSGIHEYAQILAVADIYDAMTSDRVYRRKHTPLAAAEVLVEQMFQKLDPCICNTFLANIKNSFIGNTVQLSDGRVAEIVYILDYRTGRPVVRTQDGAVIDLDENRTIDLVDFR